jgi:hypothetical protein
VPSRRLEYIKSTAPVDPVLVAAGIRRLRRALDEADDDYGSAIHPHLGRAATYEQCAAAWMHVALAIADTAEIDSVTLNAMAQALNPARENVLF